MWVARAMVSCETVFQTPSRDQAMISWMGLISAKPTSFLIEGVVEEAEFVRGYAHLVEVLVHCIPRSVRRWSVPLPHGVAMKKSNRGTLPTAHLHRTNRVASLHRQHKKHQKNCLSSPNGAPINIHIPLPNFPTFPYPNPQSYIF
jgi:hypothetical protein